MIIVHTVTTLIIEMKKIEAKIIADSINDGHRITTYLLTYPRFIHSELMTHRVFSRNSASSRAIPFEKMVKSVEEDPFVPIAWQRDHRGMQGTEYFTDEEEEVQSLIGEWLESKDQALDRAKVMAGFGLTKQLCNRLLEPFLWHTVIVTATEWDNFFELRCPQYKGKVQTWKSWKDVIKEAKSDNVFPKIISELEEMPLLDRIKLSESQAEIHIQALAEAMWDAKNESTPKELTVGEWHIPFGDQINLPFPIPIDEGYTLEQGVAIRKVKIATARCARLSYMTFDGVIDYDKDILLHNMLLESKHLSPFEHCAQAMDGSDLSWDGLTHVDASGDVWSGNFKNWKQYRHLINV